MTAGAIGRDPRFGKLALVVVGVAICAVFIFDRICQSCRFMAGFAGNGLMFIFKFKPGFIMIEIHHSLYVVK
jgi:hypothetical protein